MSVLEIWFERMGVGHLVFGLLRYGWRDRVFVSPEWSSSAERLAQLIERLTGVAVARARRPLQFAGPVQGGRALVYGQERELLEVSAAFADSCPTPPTWCCAEDFRRILGAYFITFNRHSVAFACGVAASLEGRAGVKAICHVAFPVVGRFAASQMNTRASPDFRVSAFPTLSGLIECLRFLPGHPRHWFRLLVGHRNEDCAVDPFARENGAILEQASWPSINSHPDGGHLYWEPASGLAPAQVVLYCDRSDTLADERLRRKAADKGWGWIDGASILAHLADPGGAIAEAFTRAKSLLPRRPNVVSWMHWVLAVSNGVTFRAYGDLMRRHNVAAIHHYADFGPEAVTLRLAANHSNAIVIWGLWSVLPFLIARHFWACADLILAWGAYDRDYFPAAGFDFKAIAQVGPVSSDSIADGDTARAAALRAGLSPTTRFVVAAFDTSHHPLAYNSEAQQLCFIEALVDLIERHDDWALLLKPKKSGDDRYGADLGRRLRILADQGRCLITEPREKVGVVGLAADLVVGYPINTAAILASLRGRPLVQLDLGGLVLGPLRESGIAAGLVHTTVDSFHQAVERVAAGDSGIGDIGVWRSLIDAFGDGEGPLRAGRLIGDYIRLRVEHGHDKALALAVERYAEREGSHRVCRPDAVVEGLWEAERRQYRQVAGEAR
ncbi:hypothetical protein [Paramagnetospirillum magneticum]|uniref:Uncharacterized protein n=1 Tax=Paramagnetospirillum magneticum (strain ATCC 700264 / AMB-1) TaxID=342108 RepID=Q2WB84_PARM1|nr:hypothetical protein [Paramagnetospirillum magneticum]BAE48891.1 hypothetical protein amb0087 [Paramagnetospirillum magneticum AMB-1]